MQPLLVSVSESSSMSDNVSSISFSKLSRLWIMGPISSLSSSIQFWIIGKMLLSWLSRAMTVELACDPVGGKVIVGDGMMMGELIPPPLISVTTVDLPLIVVGTVYTAGRLVTTLEPGIADDVLLPPG